jgi:hypothetical protein
MNDTMTTPALKTCLIILEAEDLSYVCRPPCQEINGVLSGWNKHSLVNTLVNNELIAN